MQQGKSYPLPVRVTATDIARQGRRSKQRHTPQASKAAKGFDTRLSGSQIDSDTYNLASAQSPQQGECELG